MKVADRIAGAIVDLAYTKNKNRWSNESSAKLDVTIEQKVGKLPRKMKKALHSKRMTKWKRKVASYINRRQIRIHDAEMVVTPDQFDTQKAAIAAGIKKVRVIETTGDELVAVKRTDVDIDSAEGRKMAYLDNLTTQVNLTWDLRAPFTQGGGLRRGCGIAA